MEFQIPTLYFPVAAPVMIVAGWGVLLMILDLFIPEEKRTWAPWLAAVGLVLAMVQSWARWGDSYGTFTAVCGHPMLGVDNCATCLDSTFLLTGLLSILISAGYLRKHELDRPEFYMLMLFSISGSMLLSRPNHLILSFPAPDGLSIPPYIIPALAWPRTA